MNKQQWKQLSEHEKLKKYTNDIINQKQKYIPFRNNDDLHQYFISFAGLSREFDELLNVIYDVRNLITFASVDESDKTTVGKILNRCMKI